MNTIAKRQKSIAGKTTGSLMNYLMGNNCSLPEVGKGATILHWTDRSAYEVISVSNDGKRVIVQQYIPERVDDLGMSDSQQYKYEKLVDRQEVIVWRNGAWRRECETIDFCDDYNAVFDRLESLCTTNEQRHNLIKKMFIPLFDENHKLMLVEGKTRKKRQYEKVNIIFGVKDEYYDYSF